MWQFNRLFSRQWTFWSKNFTWQDVLGIFIIVDLAFFAPFVSGAGGDFLRYFRPAALTGTYGVNTWNPYPAYWLIYPFALLPPMLGYLAWNLVNAGSFLYAIHRWNGRFLNFALSLPCFWVFFAGQMEGWMALGLTLGLMSHPIVAGIGLTLLSFKPQIGFLPILFIIANRRNWQILVIPVFVYGLSLLYWGWWIPEWLASLVNSPPLTAYTNLSLFPFSLPLLFLLVWGMTKIRLWLLVNSLVAPYFPVYSLSTLFCIELPGWTNFFVWVLYLSAIFLPYQVPGYLVPVGLLIVEGFYLRQASQAEKARG